MAEGLAGRVGRSDRRRPRFRATCESLEGRAMLTASLVQPADVLSPVGSGYQVALDGSGTTHNQNFTVSSSNPRIGATVAQGQFFTIGVKHDAANSSDVSFSGTMVYQMFQDLTPLTVSRISELVNQGFYLQPTAQNDPNTGQPYPTKNWHRVASGFPTATDYIVQGGSVNGDGTGEVNQPGFPFANEIVPQLAFTGKYQLAMANAGPNTNSSQFFVTTGAPGFLTGNYTLFGQLVSGSDIVDKMTKVQTTGSPKTTPVSPILFTATSLANGNPNGVIHVNTTGARAGDSATITVTATDPIDHTTVTREFKVFVPGNTQSVRVLQDTFIVTPRPRRNGGKNTVEIREFNGNLMAIVNGVADATTLAADNAIRIVAYGSKTSDTITIDPSVTVPATIDGGHGGNNRLTAGDTSSRLHGWFGQNVMKGGTEHDELIARIGHAQFQYSEGDDVYFAGEPRHNVRFRNHRALAPRGIHVKVLPPKQSGRRA